MSETILRVEDLAVMLGMNKRQIYSMTATRTRTGSMRKHPLPVVRINGNLRFRRSDIERWLAELAEEAK